MKPNAAQKRSLQEAVILYPKSQGLPTTSWWLTEPDRFYATAKQEWTRIRTSDRAQPSSSARKEWV